MWVSSVSNINDFPWTGKLKKEILAQMETETVPPSTLTPKQLVELMQRLLREELEITAKAAEIKRKLDLLLFPYE
jgi:hypothetical protein